MEITPHIFKPTMHNSEICYKCGMHFSIRGLHISFINQPIIPLKQ